MNWRKATSQAMASLLDVAFPNHCEACQTPTSSWLCDACSEELGKLAREAACAFCAAPLPACDAPCPRCRSRPKRLIRRVARLGVHDGVIRSLVLRLKYHRRPHLGAKLAEEILHQRFAEEILAEADAVVPVPLFWKREFRRGYNQADLLAGRLAREHTLPKIRALVRTGDQPSQTHLHSVAARVQNVRSAFALRRGSEKQVEGRRVVLVDDVMTTGATLRAAARALWMAKPASVSAIVVAIADPTGHDFATISS